MEGEESETLPDDDVRFVYELANSGLIIHADE